MSRTEERSTATLRTPERPNSTGLSTESDSSVPVAQEEWPEQQTAIHRSNEPRQPDGRHRIESRATFLAGFVVYFTAAMILAYKYHSLSDDAVSRMANGFYVLYSRDPHLAAIGFVWNPLQSMADLVVLLGNHLWPALASKDMAGSIVSAFAMAGGAYQLNATLREWRLPIPARILLTAAFALNPMILYYGANGMSEGLYLFTLLAATRYLLRWTRQADLRSLVYSAVALGFCYLTRNEAAGAAVVGGLVVLAVGFFRAEEEPEASFSEERRSPSRRTKVLTGLTDAVIFELPFGICAAGWATASLVITKQAFAQFSSIYGNSAQEASLAHLSLSGRLSYETQSIEALAPTLAVAVLAAAAVAFRRRNVAFLVPIAIVGGALIFDLGSYLTNTIENYLRYFITAISLNVLLIGCLFDRSRFWPGRGSKLNERSTYRRWPKVAAGILALVVSAVLILPTEVTTGKGMFNPQVGREETEFLGFIFSKHYSGGDAAAAATYPDIEAVALYFQNLHLPNGSVVVDNFSTCVPDIVTNINQPKLFVIPNDRDFQRTLADPLTFHAHYILEPNPQTEPVTAINIAYPTLWKTGAGFAKQVHQIPAGGRCPEFRLFHVVAHPDPSIS